MVICSEIIGEVLLIVIPSSSESPITYENIDKLKNHQYPSYHCSYSNGSKFLCHHIHIFRNPGSVASRRQNFLMNITNGDMRLPQNHKRYGRFFITIWFFCGSNRELLRPGHQWLPQSFDGKHYPGHDKKSGFVSPT
jgi:hypothetical protein